MLELRHQTSYSLARLLCVLAPLRRKRPSLLFPPAINRRRTPAAHGKRHMAEEAGAATCIVCYEVCPLTACVSCRNAHATCGSCIQQIATIKAESLARVDLLVQKAHAAEAEGDVRTCAELAGKMCCPLGGPAGGCDDTAPFSDRHIALLADDDVFAKYMSMQQLLPVQKRLVEIVRKREELASQFPNARQCGRCSFGPVLMSGCRTLDTHHGQVTRSGGTARIDNACPRCRWFVPDERDWPRWDPEATDLLADDPLTALFARSDAVGGGGDDEAARAARNEDLRRRRDEHHQAEEERRARRREAMGARRLREYSRDEIDELFERRRARRHRFAEQRDMGAAAPPPPPPPPQQEDAAAGLVDAAMEELAAALRRDRAADAAPLPPVLPPPLPPPADRVQALNVELSAVRASSAASVPIDDAGAALFCRLTGFAEGSLAAAHYLRHAENDVERAVRDAVQGSQMPSQAGPDDGPADPCSREACSV